MAKLPLNFFTRTDTETIAKELLGKFLFTRMGGNTTGGMIVETEAYLGAGDKACHAFNNRRTQRTEVMFQKGGISYVYLCYGIHHLFNIVTHKEGFPHAILIRAVEPLEGIKTMLRRRNKSNVTYALSSGPGAMSEALGIKTQHSGLSLKGDKIWLEDAPGIAQDRINASPRVGVSYAGEDAKLPLRFRISGNPWVSKAR